MLNFFAGIFAVAGLAAAAGPILIHLLNRRRFRTVDWAAMDFLREAMQRNRKVLQLRDLLLLLLRVLCVLLFGLALARPYFNTTADEALFHSVWPWLAAVAALGTAIWAVITPARAKRLAAGAVCVLCAALAGWGFLGVMQADAAGLASAASSRQPVHAVLIVDNSLSMGYESLDGTLLDKAKAKARDFIDTLPPESRCTVVPLCGSSHAFSLDAYRTKDDARDALDRIDVVDREGKVSQALELAQQACQQVQELAAKRVVFLGDQQLSAWSSGELQAAMKTLPELQVVQVAPESPRNVWISDFLVVDGVADAETPATFLATVHNGGASALESAQVTLSVGGNAVARQTVELQPGQERQVEFRHQIDSVVELGRPTFIKAGLQVGTGTAEADRLGNDNRRFLSVPVMAGIPVVFVDQYGAENESLEQNRIGETKLFRRLLAPRNSRDEMESQLIRVRHTTIDGLDVQTLADARLVILAGVPAPTEDAVRLLREYVLQGGRLVIAAGADFDPAAWSETAWLDGAGILPAPLKPEPLGRTLLDIRDSGSYEDVQGYQLAFDSLQHQYFRIPGESEQSLRDLYAVPLFFKLVQVDLAADQLARMREQEASRIERERTFLAELGPRLKAWDEQQKTAALGPTDESLRAQDEARLREIRPDWLLFGPERDENTDALSSAELAARARPVVRAAYAESGLPFLVERTVGQGRVLFFSSGAYSSWNTLALAESYVVMAMFDRIFRHLLQETVPTRNYAAGARITLPVERDTRRQYVLARPDGTTETLAPGALGADVYGVTIPDPLHAGHYTLTARRLDDDGRPVAGERLREVPLSVNGPVSESDLRTIAPADLRDRLGEGANYRWIAEGQPITLEGAQIRGRDVWKLLVQLVLIGLLVEMLILAWSTMKAKAEG